MNWKLISLGTAGLITLVASLIDAASDRMASETSVTKAIEQREEEVNLELEAAKEVVEAVDELNNQERKQFVSRISEWKRESGYNDQIRDIHEDKQNELEEFKRSINYDSRKSEIEDEYEDGVEACKEAIDYDYNISLSEAKIEDAKDRYKKRCRKIELVSGSDDEMSEALSDVKKSEKEKMDETIKDAKSEISDMKSKLSAEEIKLNRKKQQKLRDLESELQTTKTRLSKEEAAACRELQLKKSEEENRIREDIKASRTELSTQNLKKYDEAVAYINKQEQLDSDRANSIYQNTERYQKWADWLSQKEVPKWLVGFIGALPLIPAGYLLGGYVKFVYKVVRAM